MSVAMNVIGSLPFVDPLKPWSHCPSRWAHDIPDPPPKDAADRRSSSSCPTAAAATGPETGNSPNRRHGGGPRSAYVRGHHVIRLRKGHLSERRSPVRATRHHGAVDLAQN